MKKKESRENRENREGAGKQATRDKKIQYYMISQTTQLTKEINRERDKIE